MDVVCGARRFAWKIAVASRVGRVAEIGLGRRRLGAWPLGPRLDATRRRIFRLFVAGADPSAMASSVRTALLVTKRVFDDHLRGPAADAASRNDHTTSPS